MPNEKKPTLPIDFSHLGGKKAGHPVVDRSRKEPIDFSRIGGKRVGQALEKIEEIESDSQ
jgi:hypothetical protein